MKHPRLFSVALGERGTGTVAMESSVTANLSNRGVPRSASAAFLALGLIWAVVSLTGCPLFIRVPDVTGNTQQAAENAIEAAGLTVGEVTHEFSATVPVNIVIRQNPVGGVNARPGAAVSLTVSLGPESVEAPDVVGLTEIEAELAIQNADLVLGEVTHTFSDTVPAGSVISQNPLAGATVNSGTAVDLVVSDGPAPLLVPDVVGLTRLNAEAAITGSGLVLGGVGELESDTVPAGSVISQSPLANTPVLPGASVTLVVSSGPPCNLARVPDLTNESRFSASNTLAVSGLQLGTITEVFHATELRFGIISQDPAFGACVNAGTAINIVVSLGPEPTPIDDIAELQKIGNDPAYPLDGNYELAGDIDASSTASRKGGAGFDPIGTQAAPFIGRFYGNSFTISGLFINRPEQDNVGLFGRAGVFDSEIQTAVILDINLSGGSITGRNNTGSLCGYAGSGAITNCHSDTPVAGARYVGGLLGWASLPVDSCSTDGTVSSTLESSNEVDAIGGLAGSASGPVTNCRSSATVSGRIGVGGLLGGSGDLVSECSSDGNVTGVHAYIGGLIGVHGGGTVQDCESSSEVIGGYEVGGLIGRSYGAASVVRSAAHGNVRATLFGAAGGLIGFNYETPVSECFADGEASSVEFGSVGGLFGICGACTVS
ncbi:MAG: PASTA domain-containing protein, partial [Candidatus Hydrogenedentes bacterium]|nr:PASTA domain-containing protein [Candidatus Hydrogenedentota bacterium]